MSHPSEILTESEIAGIEREAQHTGDPERRAVLTDAVRIAKSQKSSTVLAKSLSSLYNNMGHDAFMKGLTEYNRRNEITKSTKSPDGTGNGHTTAAEQQLAADRKNTKRLSEMTPEEKVEFFANERERAQKLTAQYFAH
jgi:hypothetical protein